MGNVCKLMLSDDQHRLAVERMKRIRDRRLERQNPGHYELRSDGGGEHWAVIASLIETCKMNGVDPQAYLRDVLARIVARHPMGRIDKLLPFAYVSAADKAAA